jgi:hypothetical protein
MLKAFNILTYNKIVWRFDSLYLYISHTANWDNEYQKNKSTELISVYEF